MFVNQLTRTQYRDLVDSFAKQGVSPQNLRNWQAGKLPHRRFRPIIEDVTGKSIHDLFL